MTTISYHRDNATGHVSAEIPVRWKRHFICGKVYAIEKWSSDGGDKPHECPYCANRRLQEKDAQLEALELSNRALRGAITRMKRKSQ